MCYSCSYGGVRRVNVYLFLLGDVRDGDAGGRIFVDRRRGQTESASYYVSKTPAASESAASRRQTERIVSRQNGRLLYVVGRRALNGCR